MEDITQLVANLEGMESVAGGLWAVAVAIVVAGALRALFNE